METVIELKTDRSLLDPNFSGYKLSLSPVAVYKEDISSEVYLVYPSDDQYSFLHQKEFTLHNHLHGDPWDMENVYFVCNNWNVFKVCINNETLRLAGTKKVWEIPSKEKNRLGAYNVCISFPSPEIALISDGTGTFYVVKSSVRSLIQQWNLIQKIEPSGELKPCSLVDSRCDVDISKKTINFIVMYVSQSLRPAEENGTSEKRKASKHETVLEWITITEEEEGKWTLIRKEELRGQGAVEYAAVEPGGDAIYVASEGKFKFPNHPEPDPEPELKENESPDYFWQQTFEDIKMWIELGNECSRSDIEVTCENLTLTVTYKSEVILSGKFVQNIDSDLTTWSVNKSKLEMIFHKFVPNVTWRKVLESEKTGQEVIDEKLVAEIHEKLAHLTSESEVEGGGPAFNAAQLEECDAIDTECRNIWRFSGRDYTSTHKILVGSQQWLLNARLSGHLPPAFCVRSDVDGCVWQLHPPEATGGWPCLHTGTFLAFGYVQASKTQKKFTVTPQDLSYIAIIDVSGRLIIYRKGIAFGGSLRNRKTGEKIDQLATQTMVNLQTSDSILGAHATPTHLFVLSLKSIHVISLLYQEEIKCFMECKRNTDLDSFF